MGDMAFLPRGDVLLINGTKKAVAGWNYAKDPNVTPVLYEPENTKLTATTIPRMHCSTAAVLPDGKVFSSRKQPQLHLQIQRRGVKFLTELRVEKFHAPYLDPCSFRTGLRSSRITRTKE